MTAPTVLKLGGELLEDPARLAGVARAVAHAARTIPLVVVHGGGREIDAAMAAAGIPKQQVDGVRVTDAATLGVVIPVLAGTINTRFVAAVAAAGGRPVGLTGADATVGPVTAAGPYTAVDGRTVSLGFVGQPLTDGRADLLQVLTAAGFVPIVACIGADDAGVLYNVNADTLAAAVAVRVGAGRLVIAGTTPGVLDADGATLCDVDAALESKLVEARTVNAGMIAKLKACRAALAGGVPDVGISDGRDGARLLDTLLSSSSAGSTRVVR